MSRILNLTLVLCLMACTSLNTESHVKSNGDIYSVDRININDVRDMCSIQTSPFPMLRIDLRNGNSITYAQDGSEDISSIITFDSNTKEWVITYDIKTSE
jgi:hypothetical protein